MSEPLTPILKKFILDTIAEHQTNNQQTPNLSGQIVAVNDDGTVNVQTPNGIAMNCGTPTERTIGESVIVVTADGQQVAL